MPPHNPRSVVLLSAPGTLGGIDDRLRRAGVRLVRIPSLAIHAVEPSTWLKRLPPSPTVVIVTSRAGVAAGVVPWIQFTPGGWKGVRFWAAGPGTAAALQAAGIRKVRSPPRAGAAGIARALTQGVPQKIVYFRSDRAGPDLSHRLRQCGHEVVDLVVYRVGELPSLDDRAVRALREADYLVASSPSSLSSLRRRVSAQTFLVLRQRGRLVVLGERSRRAARGHGFRRVALAPSTTAQGFTRYLLRELRDAAA